MIRRYINCNNSALLISGNRSHSEIVNSAFKKPGLEINNKNLNKNFFLAIPLQKGQLSCRELLNGEILLNGLKKGEPLKIENIEGPYSKNKSLKEKISKRGFKI